MPQVTNIPALQTVNLDGLSLKQLTEGLSFATALTLVTSTFSRYEGIERQSFEQKWAEADKLYSGYKPVEMWPGSTTPRNTHPHRVVFDQVESALPALREAIFGMDDYFDTVPLPGGDLQSARQLKYRLKYVLAQQRGGYGPSAKSEFMEAMKSTLVYGQGVIGIEFNPALKNPEVANWDIRDVYFDYANTTPWVDNCRSVIKRSMKTVEDIEKWRGAPSITLPDENAVWTLSQHPQYAVADANKDEKLAVIGETGTVAGNAIPNPTHGLVEVLTYYSTERIITVIGRSYVIYNEKNPYGCLPLVVIPCYTYPNRFGALSYADILYEIQRVTEGLINGHLDELSLSLNPPRLMSENSMMTPSQEAYRPGSVYHGTKDDVVLLKNAAIITSIENELEHFRTQAELRTGLNGLAQGSARPGNVNRTAGGVSSQMQASALRLSTLVYNAETYGLIPLLTKLIKFLQAHEAPGDFAPGQGTSGYEMVSTSSYYRPVTIQVKAASSMLSRERLQAILPMLMQNLANGQMVQGLVAAKMTIDWSEFFRLLQDAAGTAESYALVRPMNEQELAAVNQPPPQVIAMQQKAQMDTQRALQITQMNNQTDLQIESMKAQPDPMEAQREQMKLQMEMAKAEIDRVAKERELEYKQREAELKLQIKRMEMQQKAQAAQLEQVLGVSKAQTDLRLNAQRGAVEEQSLAREAERGEAEHEFTLRSMSERGALEKKLNRDKMSMSEQRLRATREKAASPRKKTE